jgi:hypothetical protein
MSKNLFSFFAKFNRLTKKKEDNKLDKIKEILTKRPCPFVIVLLLLLLLFDANEDVLFVVVELRLCVDDNDDDDDR